MRVFHGTIIHAAERLCNADLSGLCPLHRLRLAPIKNARFATTLRYLVSGASGFLLNLAVYSVLIYGFGMWYVFASVIAFLVALCLSFFMQKFFTFRERSRDRSLGQFGAYALLLVFNLCATTLLLYLLVEYASTGRILGSIIANGIVAVWSFFFYENVIFRPKAFYVQAPMHALQNRPRVSVVIPCYNEEESIGGVIKGTPAGTFEIIVVDNNCTDKTAEIATQNGARVVPESTKGYGAALKAGFRAAKGDVIVAYDGDNQYPSYELWNIVDALTSSDLDFISASRFPLSDPLAMNRTRQIGNWGLTTAANVIFGLSLTDSQSGMWVFKRDVLDQISLKSDDMPLSQELKIKAARHPDIRFAEYKINYHPRIGESKLAPFRHGVMLLIHLCVMRVQG